MKFLCVLTNSTDFNNELTTTNLQLNKLKMEHESVKSENERLFSENKEFRIKILKYNEEIKRKK